MKASTSIISQVNYTIIKFIYTVFSSQAIEYRGLRKYFPSFVTHRAMNLQPSLHHHQVPQCSKNFNGRVFGRPRRSRTPSTKASAQPPQEQASFSALKTRGDGNDEVKLTTGLHRAPLSGGVKSSTSRCVKSCDFLKLLLHTSFLPLKALNLSSSSHNIACAVT